MSFTSWCFQQQDEAKRRGPARGTPKPEPLPDRTKVCTGCGKKKTWREYYLTNCKPIQPCKKCRKAQRRSRRIQLDDVRNATDKQMREMFGG